jgi:hypothetical protein
MTVLRRGLTPSRQVYGWMMARNSDKSRNTSPKFWSPQDSGSGCIAQSSEGVTLFSETFVPSMNCSSRTGKLRFSRDSHWSYSQSNEDRIVSGFRTGVVIAAKAAAY